MNDAFEQMHNINTEIWAEIPKTLLSLYYTPDYFFIGNCHLKKKIAGFSVSKSHLWKSTDSRISNFDL